MARKVLTNFVGGIHRSEVDKVSLSWSENMYPETVDGDQSSTNKILLSVKGQLPAHTFDDGPCRGLFRASRGINGSPVLFGCFGGSIYVIRNNSGRISVARIGGVNETSTPVSFAETGGEGSAHPHVVIVDGLSCYAVRSDLDNAGMQADWRPINLPAKVGAESLSYKIKPTHVAYLYGYLVVNDSQTDAFYTSIHYPFETTDSDGNIDYDIFYALQTSEYAGYGFVTYAEWMPDNITAITSNGSYLYAFGPRSVQVFSYRDDVNYPFVSPDSACEAIGLRATYSVASCGPYMAWLGSSDIGQNGVYIMEGATKKRVSTNYIETEIAKMSNPEDAVGQMWSERQHVFYAITFITDKKTFVYDLTEGEWHSRSSYNNGYWRLCHACFAYNRIFFGSVEDGTLSAQDESTFTEYDGKPIVRTRRGGVVFSDNSPFYCDAFELECNNGQISMTEINPSVVLCYSVDGGAFTDKFIGNMGGIGRYDYRTAWYRLGLCRFLTVEVTVSDPVDFSILGAKIDATACSMM